ncbi:MAG: M24 family metallopeptidase, partial [Acidobacteriota bacterium]
KLTHWEYWPFGIIQAPLFFYYPWLALKSRSLFFFSASNPGILMGGMFGEEFLWHDEKATGDLLLRKAKELLGQSAKIATDIVLFPDARPIENKIAPCRYSLTTDELVRYRTLGRDSGAAIRQVIDKIEPGQTESEIAETLRHELASCGMASVVTLVAADERISQFRHPVPTAHRWRKTLLLVTCAKRGGLITSQSRLVCVGDAPDGVKKKTEATAYVNACLLDATRPGITGAELYSVAANAYSEKNFANEINKHHQGGAAGYKTREWVAHPKSDEVVQPNQAFAWNPSITGTKVEETCVTSENGVEIVTASPDFPQIVTLVNGREYYSPGILSL